MHFRKKSLSLTNLWPRGQTDMELLREYLKRHQKDAARAMLSRMDLSGVQWEDDILRYTVDEGLWIEGMPIACLERVVLDRREETLLPILREKWLKECMERDDPRLFPRLFGICPTILSEDIADVGTKMRRLLYDLGVPTITSHSSRRLSQDVYECAIVSPVVLEDVVSLEDEHHNNLLHYAVLHHNMEFVRLLLTKQIPLNKKNIWSLTPLNEAVRIGNHEIAALLRDHGASLHTIRDSAQSIIGRRRDFFHLLEDLMHIMPHVFPQQDVVFQLFHSVSSKTHLYCCSLFHASEELRDFHDQMRGCVLDRNNDTFFVGAIRHCDKKTQHEFFLAPLCQDHAVHFLFTRPFHQGMTFLGYFLLWCRETPDLSTFWTFLDHFLRYEWTHCLRLYPHLTALRRLKRFLLMADRHRMDLASPYSQDFIPAIRWWCQKPDDLSILSLLRTHLDCHIPVSSTARDVLDALLAIDPPLPPSSSPSFLFQKMKTIEFPSQSVLIQDHSPLLLRSIDLFEIIGNHHPEDYRSYLHAINNLIRQDWLGSEETLFRELVSMFGLSFRTAAVLGVAHTFSYRLFLPHYEIEEALAYVFSLHEDPLLHFFRIYHTLVEWIHPFEDGNGRLGRLLFTILLRSKGFPCIIHSEYKIMTFLQYLDHLKRISTHSI